MTHFIKPTPQTLHGFVSRDRQPVLEIESGDTVIFETLDSMWGRDDGDPFGLLVKEPRPSENDSGHALVGPVAIKGAKAGQTLEIRIKRIVTGSRGWVTAGGFPNWPATALGIDKDANEWFPFALDAIRNVATTRSGHTFELSPFMGFIGNASAEAGVLATRPPRSVGGNIDCRELVEGSVLWLPIEVDSALFSTGDGHALQGDGEVAGPALECPMKHIELEFHVRDIHLTSPRAVTPAGWVTMGFGATLDEACIRALGSMIEWMVESGSNSRQEAIAEFSLFGSLRITQIVNETKGVHAILTPSGLTLGPPIAMR